MDADAAAYIAAVTAAKGSAPSPTQVAAINAFYVAEKAGSHYTSLKRLYLPIWANVAANAIDLITLASGTFVGSVTHAAGYVQGDGLTGYFNSLESFPGVGADETTVCMWALVNLAPTGAFPLICGSGAVILSDMYFSPTGIALRYTTGGSASANGETTRNGILIGNRNGGSARLSRRSSSGRALLAEEVVADGDTPNPGHVLFMAKNSSDLGGDPAPTGHSDARCGMFGYGLGLTDTDDTAFSLNLKTLWETCTGLTLP